MRAGDDSNVPKPWENEEIDPVLPGLLGVSGNSLPDDVFERILATAMDSVNELADESLIPPEDDPALTEDGDFLNPDEAVLFLSGDGLGLADDEMEGPGGEDEGGENGSRGDHEDGFFGGEDFGVDGSIEGFSVDGDSREDDLGREWS